ncbi:MAG TPA: hypothetical protein VHW01_00085 [Polyangiaceae bacterium]|nr:hypothetical protein [Polyangiaceae bacterium]
MSLKREEPGPSALPPPSALPSFRELFEGQFSYVWNVLKRLSVAERDLEDLAQQVFLQVHAQLASFDSRRPLRPDATDAAKPVEPQEKPRNSDPTGSESANPRQAAAAGSATKRRAPPTKIQPPRYPKGTPIGLRAGVFSSLGVAPALAAGFRAGASVRRDWFELTAEFSDQLEASRSAGDGGTVIGSLAEGTLAPCFAWSALAACALLNLGSLKSRGKDVPQPVNQRSLYAALGARFELSPHLFDKLHLLVNADALKSLTPITLRLRGEDIWHTPFISAAASVGLEWRFQ